MNKLTSVIVASEHDTVVTIQARWISMYRNRKMHYADVDRCDWRLVITASIMIHGHPAIGWDYYYIRTVMPSH
jgi:hypothetical protein